MAAASLLLHTVTPASTDFPQSFCSILRAAWSLVPPGHVSSQCCLPDGHKAQSVATDHTSNEDIYITQWLYNVCPCSFPVYWIPTAAETVSQPLVPPSLSPPHFVLKTIWLQWCVVWHTAHPAALSLLGLLVKNKKRCVCICACIATILTRNRKREDGSAASHREGDFCSAWLSQSVQHFFQCCVRVPPHGLGVAAIRSRNNSPVLSVTTETSKLPYAVQCNTNWLSMWVAVLVLVCEYEHTARLWPWYECGRRCTCLTLPWIKSPFCL